MTISKLVESSVWPSTIVATAATTSPIWLPSLQEVSEAAALWLPIIGVVWLVLQIGFFVFSRLDQRWKGK